MTFMVRNLRDVFNLNRVIFYEGQLYEKLSRVSGGPRFKYRVILSEDHYDYVVEPKIRKRLDRAFKRRQS